MTEADTFSAPRLDLARRLRGMTQIALAREVGISTKSLNRYLTKGNAPQAEVVGRFATTLNFPARFFYGLVPESIEPSAPSFRALSTMTRRQRDQACAAGVLGVYLSDWVDSHFRLPPISVEHYQDTHPDVAAMALRDAWGLGQRPINNMVHLLEAHGVRVLALPVDLESVDAYSFWSSSSKPFVFLNTASTAERSRMDTAHELGHLVMHRWGGVQRSRRAEEEAKCFASSFLMPAENVISHFRPNPFLNQIVAGKALWRVSASSLAYRLHQLEMMSSHHYKRIFVELSSAGYRKQEPEPIERETSLTFAQVLDKLRRRNVSIASVARELYVYPQDLSRLLYRLTKTPLPI